MKNTLWQVWKDHDDRYALLKEWYANGTLEKELPEVFCLYGIPQPEAHHPEIDTGVHVEMVVQQAQRLSNDPSILWACLMHDLGKGVTNKDFWPQHIDHEELGKPLVENVCARLNVPSDTTELSVSVCVDHLRCHRALDMRPGNLIQWMEQTGYLFDESKLVQFVTACEADARGRLGLEHRMYAQKPYILEVRNIASTFFKGERTREIELGEAIHAVQSRLGKNAAARLAYFHDADASDDQPSMC